MFRRNNSRLSKPPKVVRPFSQWQRDFHPGVYLVPNNQIPEFKVEYSGRGSNSAFWTGVRGAQYFQSNLRKLKGGSLFGKLVLEPENQFDPFAVAVYAEGRKIGYLSANSSRHYFPRLGFLANSEQLLGVPVHVSHPDLDHDDYVYLSEVDEEPTTDAYVCVPSLEYFDQILPDVVLFDRLQLMWNALPPSVIEQVKQDRFHLTNEVFLELMNYKHLAAPYQFQDWFDPHQQDGVLERFLWHTRKNLRAEEDQARLERNEKIADWAAKGLSNSEIATRVGLKPSTVSGIVRKASRPKPNKPKEIGQVEG